MGIFGSGSIAAFVIGSIASSIGADYYGSLEKPAWTPPGWLFGAVWLVIYAAMALAAWLVWRQGGIRRRWREIGTYSVQFWLNVAWPVVFFAFELPALALAVILALDVLVAATTALFYRRSHLAARLFAVYFVWLVFATTLNVGIVALT